MGQKKTRQYNSDANGTGNPVREAETTGEATITQTLGSVSVSETDTKAESVDELVDSEAMEKEINDFGKASDLSDEDAAIVKEQLARSSDLFTPTQLSQAATEPEEADDLAASVLAPTDKKGNISSIDQRIGVEEGVSESEARKAVVDSVLSLNGVDAENHMAEERARKEYEENGIEAAVPTTEQELNERKLEIENPSMTTDKVEELVDVANDIYEKKAREAMNSDEQTEPEYLFDGAREDADSVAFSAKRAAELYIDSLTDPDPTWGTNGFSNEGEDFKDVFDTIGDAASDKSKEMASFLHDESEEIDGVESPWENNPTPEADYDETEMASQFYSNLNLGSGVDARFFR